MKNAKVTSLADAKKEKERRDHAARVLSAFDRMEHEDKRSALERKAEVERASRQRL